MGKHKKKPTLDDLLEMDLDKLPLEKRIAIQELIAELRTRKLKYPIMDFRPLPHQQELIEAITKKHKTKSIPQYKFIMFIGGNGSGKTIGSVYIDICMALGKDGEKYGLPYLGEAKQMLIVTKTSDIVKTNLEPYFLGTDSISDTIKIPKQEIKKINRDGSTRSLKEIILKNGCSILFRTYDAGQSRLEGSSPDFIHMDELPERGDIFLELLRGTRKSGAQMLMSFTPTKFNPAVYDYFYGQDNDEVVDRTFIRKVNSLENTSSGVDHSWLLGLSEEEQKIRMNGDFVPPTGLVYNQFSRNTHLVPFFEPKELGSQVLYYGGLDFGVTHPMAHLFMAVNEDGVVYVFDMLYEKNLLLSDLVSMVADKKKEHGFELEYTVADTADARARMELNEVHGMKTVPADKWSKGENNLSNRRAGIFRINEMLKNGKLFISDRCMKLVQELETHAYKGNGTEDVKKENDDAIDALRYFIFSYRPPDKKREYKRNIRRIKRSEGKNVINY